MTRFGGIFAFFAKIVTKHNKLDINKKRNYKHMKRDCFYNFLEKLAKPVWIAVIVLVYLLFQYAFDGMFEATTSHLNELSGSTIPDLKFYYTPDQLKTVFQNFGREGIDEYLDLQLVDMVYPLSYSLLLAVLLFIGYGKTKYRSVTWLPVVAAAADYTENFLIRSLAVRFPAFNETVARIAAFFTAWKWIFITLSIVLVLGSFFAWIIKKLKPSA